MDGGSNRKRRTTRKRKKELRVFLKPAGASGGTPYEGSEIWNRSTTGRGGGKGEEPSRVSIERKHKGHSRAVAKNKKVVETKVKGIIGGEA